MRTILPVGVILFNACAFSVASNFQMYKPAAMAKHEINKNEVVSYEESIPLTTALSCRQYMGKTLSSIRRTQIYKMPTVKDTYLAIAGGPTEKDGGSKDSIVVLEEAGKLIRNVSQRLQVEGSWNPSCYFYVSDGRTLIISEVNSEDFGYYQVLEYNDSKLIHLGDIKIDQYINGKPLAEMGDLLDGADVNRVNGKYEIVLNSLVKKGWAPSISAVTFRF